MGHVFSIRTMWRSFFCALMATFTLAVCRFVSSQNSFDTSVRPSTRSAPGSLSFSRSPTVGIGTFLRFSFSSSLESLGYEVPSLLKNEPDVELKGFVRRFRSQLQYSSRRISSKTFSQPCSSRGHDPCNHNCHDRLLQSIPQN